MEIQVECPGTRYALSGGVSKMGNLADLTVHESYPVSELIDGRYVATGWNLSVSTENDAASAASPWAVCANI